MLINVLIAAAIVGILVAIAIPVFADQAVYTHLANDKETIHEAKVAAILKFKSDEKESATNYAYDYATGSVYDLSIPEQSAVANTIQPYGQVTDADVKRLYDEKKDDDLSGTSVTDETSAYPNECFLVVNLNSSGKVSSVYWQKPL